MLKERARLLIGSVFALDLALVAVAFVAGHRVRTLLPHLPGEAFPPLYPLTAYLPLLPVALLIWGALLLSSGSYRSHRTVPLLDEAWSVVRTCGTGMIVFAITLFSLRLDERLLGDDRVSRTWLLLFGVIACLLLLAEKVALRTASRYVRSRGFNYRTLLIIGTGAAARALARSVHQHRYWGFQILGFVSTEEEIPGNLPEGAVLGGVEDVAALLEEEVVDDVIFAVGRRDLMRLEELFLLFEDRGIRTLFALNFFPHTRARMQLSEIDGVPVLTFSTAPTSLLPLVFKRAMDIALSALLLVLALPLVIVIAAAVKLSDRGSVLFRQTRCGLNGRRFTLYKFRTMVEDAEARREGLLPFNERNGPAFKLAQDPRVTGLGKILRRFSLDELPQLWNVLRGDMSLVGPRPPIPEEVSRYARWQRRRLSMKPGLTGLGQVEGRDQTDFNRWIDLDLEYIDSWSLWLDLKILLKTIPAVLSGRGAA